MIRPAMSLHDRRTGEQGFVLVTVLWLLAALATFVSVYTVYVSNTAVAAAVRSDDLVAHGLATAAMELAALRLLSVPKAQRPTFGEVTFRMGRARVAAGFRDEAARIDLNGASRELLAGLFIALGAEREPAGEYADRLVAWRAPASAKEGDEVERYRSAGLDYGPRGGSFVHAEEIWRVVGLPPALVGAALPHLTVYSGRSEIDVEAADPVVRAAISAANPRGGSEAEGEVALAAGTTTQPGDAVRIAIAVDFDSGRRRAAEAVILLRDFGDDPYRVLAWRDDPEASGDAHTRPGATTGGRP